jgi:sterol desaturase/sphingolipid hydroxylase (fatty acid hydroxylase superfamily)
MKASRLRLPTSLLALFVVGAVLSMLAAGLERLAVGGDGSIVSAPWAGLDLWAGIGLPVAALLVEWLVVGWNGCSLRKILSASQSARSDLAFWVFNLSGGMAVLARLAACGAFAWLGDFEKSHQGLLPLGDLGLLWAFPLYCALTSFVEYWEHRALHSRLLWPLHRAHHSAHEFTIVNAQRAHPFEVASAALIDVVPPLLVGFSPEQVAIFGSILVVQGAFIHSNWTKAAWLERWGLNTPAGHRLHHALAAHYHNRNFGQLSNAWDRLFGTYAAPGPDVVSVEIGVEAPEGRHNTTNLLHEFALQSADWLIAMRMEVARAAAIVADCRRVVRGAPSA